ncbi:F-box protein CPR1-like [Bidens hawaiensis]|uniref:F-box protein CPR1-like n=1 Tax=Bidens hawaiensis TaxID=980011 RepID=UPI0040499D00
MANIDDNVLHNILARLPGKPLLRFRSASKHWNRLISYPHFMTSGSRRMILLPFARPLVVIDDNVPAEDKAHSMVKVQSSLEYQEGTNVSVVGTIDGVVLLSLTNRELICCKLILYNPLTCVCKLIMDCKHNYRFVFGFGYGETKHDLKIVRFEFIRDVNLHKWDVFDLKTSLWSTQPQYMEHNTYFGGDVGVFINGFLYWGIGNGILALNVKEMVFSKIKLPVGVRGIMRLLGTIDGRICVMKNVKITTFHLWLMNDDCSWMKTHSFTFNLDLGNSWCHMFYPVCILDNGKILMANGLVPFAIYDTSTHSHKRLNNLDDVKWRDYIFDFEDNRAMEYVESLVSPSDMCGGI